MPSIYLSPSTQEYNLYYDGAGSEEYYMNLIADAMEPYLTASGIVFTRNTPDMTAASSIRASNAGNYDAHVALHSNAAPESLSGRLRGIDIYYYPGSERSHRLADDMVAQLRAIYPLPDLVRARPTTSIGEVSRTRAPAVLAELGYHDNPDDAAWVGQYRAHCAPSGDGPDKLFRDPLLGARTHLTATVDLNGGNLNIRARPSLDAQIIGRAPDGAQVTVLGSWNGWYVIRYGTVEGYARSEYITLNYS